MAMTGDELKAIRKALGLSQGELQQWLMMKDESGWTVRMIEGGKKEMTGPMEVAIRAFADGYRPSHVATEDTPLAKMGE